MSDNTYNVSKHNLSIILCSVHKSIRIMNYKSQTICWTTFRPKRRAGGNGKNGSIGNRNETVCVACGSTILPKQAKTFVDAGVYATLLGRFGRCRCGCPCNLAVGCGATDREGVTIQDGAVYAKYVVICISDHKQLCACSLTCNTDADDFNMYEHLCCPSLGRQ